MLKQLLTHSSDSRRSILTSSYRVKALERSFSSSRKIKKKSKVGLAAISNTQMTLQEIDLWVSAGNFEAPYYRFYADSSGSQELTNLALDTNISYTFRRLNEETSHPFYISDTGYKQTSSNALLITGQGSPVRGITGDQSFNIIFDDSIKDVNGLVYYCSSHSSMQGTINLVQEQESKPEISVYRLYNSTQNKHLFSSNQYEIDLLSGSGWKNEGVIYSAPEDATADVFRFYIPSENRHFYTALKSERDGIIAKQDVFSDWEYEGAAFSAYSTGDFPSDAIAVVRYFNEESGNHVYSTRTYEQGLLDSDRNWVNEGIAWYGDPMVATTDLV